MDHRAGWRNVTIRHRPIPCPVWVHPPVMLEPCQPSPPDRVNLFDVHQAAVAAVKKHIFPLESPFLGHVNQSPEMVVLGLAIIRLAIDQVIARKVALTIGPKQRQQINPFDNGMVLARPHVVDKIHLAFVWFVQNRIVQHQYPGGQTHLRLHLKPKCIVCWLKRVQQTGVRIMCVFARTNRISPLRFHRRRIHRSGDQKVDEVFTGEFRIFFRC